MTRKTVETRAQIRQRWRDLRAMLIDQLEMFERGALTLHSSDVDISPDAIADLKGSIREFSALIDEDMPAA